MTKRDQHFKVGDTVDYYKSGYSSRRATITRLSEHTMWLSDNHKIKHTIRGWRGVTLVTQAKLDHERAHAAWLSRKPTTRHARLEYGTYVVSVSGKTATEVIVKLEDADKEIRTLAEWAAAKPTMENEP